MLTRLDVRICLGKVLICDAIDILKTQCPCKMVSDSKISLIREGSVNAAVHQSTITVGNGQDIFRKQFLHLLREFRSHLYISQCTCYGSGIDLLSAKQDRCLAGIERRIECRRSRWRGRCAHAVRACGQLQRRSRKLAVVIVGCYDIVVPVIDDQSECHILRSSALEDRVYGHVLLQADIQVAGLHFSRLRLILETGSAADSKQHGHRYSIYGFKHDYSTTGL